WWRDTAARLLLEHPDRTEIPALEKLAGHETAPYSAVQSLYTISQIGALNDGMLISAFHDRNTRLREAALRLSSSRPHLLKEVTSLANDDDAAVRLWVALVLSDADLDARIEPLSTLACRADLDQFSATAIRSSIPQRPFLLLQKIQQTR